MLGYLAIVALVAALAARSDPEPHGVIVIVDDAPPDREPAGRPPSTRVKFHGAFKSEADAEKRAQQLGGWVEGVEYKGQGFRYVVKTRRDR